MSHSGEHDQQNKCWYSGEGKTQAKSGKFWNLPCLPPFLPTQPAQGVTNWDASRPRYFWSTQIFANSPALCQPLKLGNVMPPSRLSSSSEGADPSQPAHVSSGRSREARAPFHTARVLRFAVCPVIFYLAHLTHSCYLCSHRRHASL